MAMARSGVFQSGNRLTFATIASTGCEEYPTKMLVATPHRFVFEMKRFSACLDDQHWAVPVIQLSGIQPDLSGRVRISLRYPWGLTVTLTCEPGGKPCHQTSTQRKAGTP